MPLFWISLCNERIASFPGLPLSHVPHGRKRRRRKKLSLMNEHITSRIKSADFGLVTILMFIHTISKWGKMTIKNMNFIQWTEKNSFTKWHS